MLTFQQAAERAEESGREQAAEHGGTYQPAIGGWMTDHGFIVNDGIKDRVPMDWHLAVVSHDGTVTRESVISLFGEMDRAIEVGVHEPND